MNKTVKIIIAVAVIIAFAIIKSKRKDFKLEANKLIMLLGGKDNVIDYEFTVPNTATLILDGKRSELEKGIHKFSIKI